ncbi:MAG: DUF438 domain-containing protein [Deferribacterales bacterium]
MSEWLHKENTHMDNLRKYCEGMLNEEDGMTLFKEYESDILSVRFDEVMALVDWMVKSEKYDMENIKNALNKIINIFSGHLDEFGFKPTTPEFISILHDENTAIAEYMESIKDDLRALGREKKGTADFTLAREEMKKAIEGLSALDAHYIKKENILFPYVEKYIPDYRCTHVMWSIHDDVRNGIKKLAQMLSDDDYDEIQFNRTIGRLFFDIFGLIFREDYILLPMCLKLISGDILAEMLPQCPEIGYTFIPAPKISPNKPKQADIPDGLVNLETGSLTAEQLILMLNSLPVDITYVDENDCVRYFSSPKDRIFPRSKAIIGRTVQNCHPPDSIHIVNEVVKRLKSGAKDVESFWIQMGGKFILIQYFAVRDRHGAYKGTLEVSQDISDIRQLTGEKRLLDLDK